MSSYIRKTQRKKRLMHRCKKCHTKLIEKEGYGWICDRCGWEEPFVSDINVISNEVKE